MKRLVCITFLVLSGAFWFAVLDGTRDNRLTPEQQVGMWFSLLKNWSPK